MFWKKKPLFDPDYDYVYTEKQVATNVAFITSLINTLVKKGVITVEELDECYRNYIETYAPYGMKTGTDTFIAWKKDKSDKDKKNDD